MSMQRIPESFVFTCDACEAEQKRETAYFPQDWAELRLEGNAKNSPSIRMLLCAHCTKVLREMLPRKVTDAAAL